MKSIFLIILVHFFALLPTLGAMPTETESAAVRQLRAQASAACETAAAELGAATRACRSLNIERVELADGIAWYRFDLQVGKGTYDIIRLHRVVAEHAPYVPKPTSQAVMTVHGDRFTWQATYLSSATAPSVPDDQAIAAFLAAGGVDVWGIDFRWVLVPDDVEDTAFMTPWGMQTHIDDLRSALSVARFTRLLTGSGFGQLHLMGWSRGGFIGYAYLNAESQRPRYLRHVKGFIPTDMWIKTDDETLRQSACTELADLQTNFDAGQTVASGFFTNEIGRLALEAPEDPSPFFSLFTNRQLGLCVGTFPRDTPTPGWHPVGGVYDDDFFFPQFLLYSDEVNWFTHLATGAAFQPLQVVIDAETLVCDEVDSPYDDHLADIRVPVLYVGAEGAFGSFGVYSTTLLGSSDVSSLVVSLQPPALQIQDLGHADIFLAANADTLFWQPILDWIAAH